MLKGHKDKGKIIERKGIGGADSETKVNEFIHTRRCNTAPWAESNFVSRPADRTAGAANARHGGHFAAFKRNSYGI